MPIRKRVRWGLTTALAILATLALALPASAEPPGLAIDAGNGRRVVRIEHPTIDGWYVTLAVDVHLAFDESSGDLVAAGAVSRLSDGPGARRFEVTLQRLRIDQDAVAADEVVNDFFPSKSETARTNTQPTCADPEPLTILSGGIIATAPGTTSLYDEAAPKDGDCETEADEVANALNSAFDYAPNASTVRAYADLIQVQGSGVVSQRTYIRVRWDNNQLTAHSLASTQAAYNV